MNRLGSKTVHRASHHGMKAVLCSIMIGIMPILPAQSKLQAPLDSVSATISFHALPREAQVTYRLVLSGGPFPYEKDGTVFGNRERLLPAMKRGYYREYTVKTPRVSHRGARRLVCGGLQPTSPESCYYSADHYASFKRIEPLINQAQAIEH